MITFLAILVAVGFGGFTLYQVFTYNRFSVAGALGTLVGLGLIWGSTGVVQINAGEVGVVTRFGQVTGREVTEGLSFKAPAPIESVTVFNTRVQKKEVDSTAATKDLQDVNSKLALNYHVNRGSVSELYRTVGSDFEAKIVDPALQEVFKAASAKFTASEIITKRDELKKLAQDGLTARLAEFGLTVDSINLVNFSFSAVFNKSIEDVQVANQRANEALAKLEQVKAEAQQDIEKAKAQAEAQRQQAQSITPEYLELKRLEKWNGAYPQVVGEGNLLQIPLK